MESILTSWLAKRISIPTEICYENYNFLNNVIKNQDLISENDNIFKLTVANLYIIHPFDMNDEIQQILFNLFKNPNENDIQPDQIHLGSFFSFMFFFLSLFPSSLFLALLLASFISSSSFSLPFLSSFSSLLLFLSCSTPLSLVPLLPLFLPVLSVTLFLPSNRIARFFRTLSPFLCLSFFLLPPFAIPLFTPCHCSCPFPLSSLSSSFPSTQNAFQVSFHSVCQRQENK